MDDLVPLLSRADQGRSFEKGKAAYEAAQCYKCHRFNGDGGSTGPDLTGVGNRFDARYLLEALVLPSQVVSDQYVNTVIYTNSGEVITGRIIEEDDQWVKVRTDPFARELVPIPKAHIDERQPSKLSEMPQGLINTLTPEEILDLIAYMRSAGSAEDRAFGN
jgi:putative heme-binding domain-containing protein